MPQCRDLVEDTSELFAFEPLDRRIKQVQIRRVGIGHLLAIVRRD
jgi:hypothetical protein